MIDITSLNDKEKDAIRELQKRVEGIIPHDLQDDLISYYRFLKARDFNLDKAEKMLIKHIQWRKHHQIDSIVENFKPKEFFLHMNDKRVIGCDKEGDIVFYVPSGKLNARDVLKCVKLNDYMKHVAWFSEKWATVVKKQREKEGMKSQQLTMISDADGMSFANVSSKAFIEVSLRSAQILQDNFPETVKNVIVINAPSAYVFLHNLMKPFVSKAFLEKIHIYGHSGWEEKLLQTVDEEILPKFLGGKRTDPDGNPLCKTVISHWSPLPERFYLPEEDRLFKDTSRVLKISVPHSSKKDVNINVTAEGSVIRWEFLVKDKDIGFGLFFQGSDDLLEILPIQKCDTTDGVEIGFYKTKLTGKYIITFDNSYSWFSSKEIEYCISVLKNEIETVDN